MQIGAIALVQGLILVTHNTHKFGRIPGLSAAYARLSRLQIDWEGKPITDRDEANARSNVRPVLTGERDKSRLQSDD